MATTIPMPPLERTVVSPPRPPERRKRDRTLVGLVVASGPVKAAGAAATVAISWATFWWGGSRGLPWFGVWVLVHAWFYSLLEAQLRRTLLEYFAAYCRKGDIAFAAAEDGSPSLDQAVAWLSERARADGQRSPPGSRAGGGGAEVEQALLRRLAPRRYHSEDVAADRRNSGLVPRRIDVPGGGGAPGGSGHRLNGVGNAAAGNAACASSASLHGLASSTDSAARAREPTHSVDFGNRGGLAGDDGWLVGQGIDSDADDQSPRSGGRGTPRGGASGASSVAEGGGGRGISRHASGTSRTSRAGSWASSSVPFVPASRPASRVTSRAGSRAGSWHDAEAELDLRNWPAVGGVAAADSDNSNASRGGRSAGEGGAAGLRAAAPAAVAATAALAEAGEQSSGRVEELGLEVDGRQQLLLRRAESQATPSSEEQQMVHDLLAAVSDAPRRSIRAVAAVEDSSSSGWSLVRDRRGIKVWTSPVPKSPFCRIRARLACEATPQQLLSVLIDDSRIGDYDAMFHRIEPIERIDDRTSIRWSCYRAVWPTRPRDFVIKSTWEEFADGTVVLATQSVDHPARPETPYFVRGNMVLCGYVISPREVSPAQLRAQEAFISDTDAAAAAAALVGGDVAEAAAATAAAAKAAAAAAEAAAAGIPGQIAVDSSAAGSNVTVAGSEIIMYSQTDLGGALPSSVVNRLCKKPAYRVLRKIQKMVLNRTLLTGPMRGDSNGNNGDASPTSTAGYRRQRLRSNSRSFLTLSRVDSDDGLETLPSMAAAAEELDRRGAAAAGALNGSANENEIVGASGEPNQVAVAAGAESAQAELERIRRDPSLAAASLAAGLSQLPRIRPGYVMAESRRIMASVQRMASDATLKWDRMHHPGSGMNLYKSAVSGTRKWRLGAAAVMNAGADELLGILAESAAMLGPDYVVDRQEKVDTFPSHFTDAEGLDGAGDSINVFWFSCTHKRQRIRRDFVILRCIHRLEGGGGIMAYASVEHPALPPCPELVRGKVEASGFVIVPKSYRRRREQPPAADDGSGTTHAIRRGRSNTGAGEGSAARSSLRAGGHQRRSLWGRSRSPMPPQPAFESDDSPCEVTFFTQLSFSESLPIFQTAEACVHMMGPMHILLELKGVVDQAFGNGAPVEISANLNAGEGGEGALPLAHSEGQRLGLSDGENEEDRSRERAEKSSTAVRLRVEARREAALRDLLALAGDGECMDGPQVNWALARDGGPEGIKLWKATVPGSVWCIIRVRATLPATPAEVLELLLDDSRIGEYDELFDKISLVESMDNGGSAFKRTCYKPIWPTAPRDFSLLSTWGKLQDGSAYVCNRSVDHPGCPPVHGYVRGVVMLCGFLMVPDVPLGPAQDRKEGAGDGAAIGQAQKPRCTLTMIVHTDLCGKLPASILNVLSVSAPAGVAQRLQKMLAKRRQEEAAEAATVAAAVAVPAAGAAALEAEEGDDNGEE